jgi:hypothetical protein
MKENHSAHQNKDPLLTEIEKLKKEFEKKPRQLAQKLLQLYHTTNLSADQSATSTFIKHITDNNTSTEYIPYLALLFDNQGFPKEQTTLPLCQYYSRQYSSQPDDMEKDIEEASAYILGEDAGKGFHEKDLDAAIALLFPIAITTTQKDSETLDRANYLLGRCYQKQGLLDKAYWYFNKIECNKYKNKSELKIKTIKNKLKVLEIKKEELRLLTQKKGFEFVTPTILAYVTPKIDIIIKNELDPAHEKQTQYQQRTKVLFFAPQRNKKSDIINKYTEEFENRRTGKTKTKAPIQLGNPTISTRTLATTERNILERAIKKVDGNTLFPQQTRRSSSKFGWEGYTEYISFNKQENKHEKISYFQRCSDDHSHLGNYMMENIGKYGYSGNNAILKKIDFITQQAPYKERALAELMKKFARDSKPITQKELAALNPSVVDRDVLFINSFCYHLFVKETTRWMHSWDEDLDFQDSSTVSRVIQLLCDGKISMQDAFSRNSKINPITIAERKSNTNPVNKALKKLNSEYNKNLLRIEAEACNPDFFIRNKDQNFTLIATPEHLHQEHKKVFGGDSDSEDEDYDNEVKKESSFIKKQ